MSMQVIQSSTHASLSPWNTANSTAFEPLLRVPEAAKLLGVHEKTIQAMARAGEIPSVKLGKYWYFRASSLDAWFREQLECQQSRRVSTEAIS